MLKRAKGDKGKMFLSLLDFKFILTAIHWQPLGGTQSNGFFVRPGAVPSEIKGWRGNREPKKLLGTVKRR